MLGGDDAPSQGRQRAWWFRPAIAGAVLIVLLVVGALLSHSGGTSAHGQAAPAAPSGNGGSPPAAVAPAPSQTSPVDPGAGSRVVDGVPVGYPQSQSGAVAAAVNYELARSTAGYFTSAVTRHGILQTITASGSLAQELKAQDSATAQFDASIGLSSSNSGSLVARAAALGTRVDSYNQSTATVEVWTCGLVGITSTSSPLPVSASWMTYTMTLQWESGDWKLTSISGAVGPTPLQDSSNTPSGTSDFNTANEEFNAPPYVG
jgi:hypothetical protein